MIDRASAMPCDVLISVVGLARRWDNVIWCRELALGLSIGPHPLNVIVVNDLLASNDNLGPEFAKYRPSCDHPDGSSFV